MDNRVTVASASLVAKPAPAHTVRLGAEYRRNTLVYGVGKIGYDLFAPSAMWSWQASDALAITGAARVDFVDLGRTGPQDVPNFIFENADYSRRFSEWSYNLGAVLRLSEADSLTFTLARGVGSPSLLEYGMQILYTEPSELQEGGSPSLDATIVQNASVDWNHTLPAVQGGLRFSVFWQSNEDIRSFDARTTPLSSGGVAILAGNIGDSTLFGAELGAHGRTGPFEWYARYSWRHVDDDMIVPASMVGVDYESGSPESVATAGVIWSNESWELGADARYVSATVQYGLLPGGLPGQTVPAYGVDGYVQASLHAAWAPRADIRIELAGRDLLEEDTIGIAPAQPSVYLSVSKRL